MFTFFAVLTTVSACLMLLAGGLSFLRNPQNSEHRWFLAVAITISAWMPANFFDSNIYNSLTPLLVKVDFSAALLIAWSLLQFNAALLHADSFHIVSKKHHLARYTSFRLTTLILNSVLIIAIFSGLLFQTSYIHRALSVETKPLFTVYVILIVFYFAYGLILLSSAYRHAIPGRRQGVDLIWFGFLTAITTNVLTNMVFPSIIHSRHIIQELNIIGYAGIFLLVGSIYAAITFRKFFDIRLVVARSLAYLLSLGTLIILFIFSAFAVSNLLLGHTNNIVTLRWMYAVLAVILALIFAPLKQFFDRVTNNIFYRDTYDSQVLLDNFNKMLVTTHDVIEIAQKTSHILEASLKPDFSAVTLKQNDIVDVGELNSKVAARFSAENLVALRTELPKIKEHIFLIDSLGNSHEKIRNILQSQGIVLAARLSPTDSAQRIGYLLLGPKKSGNSYNAQDIRVLEIIANELLIALQNALRYREIENFTTTLQQKVDKATRQLRNNNEKLKALDETKDEFVSMASHQLRTPLTSVKGYISMVLEGDAGKLNEVQRQMLGQALTSSQRMVYLIADLLNVSRLKTGKFVIQASPVNLAALVGEEIGQLQETAASRSVSLTFDAPADFPELQLDETKTRQIIMNFVDNAIYYTPVGGHIAVRLLNKPHTIEFRVEDDGIGVPKADQPHLFTKFYRAGNARKARPDGTGLGLFMAKKVIVAEGGALIFDSHEGQGSTFGFIFNKS